MNRCQPKRVHLALAFLLCISTLSALPLPAAAQLTVIREAPRDVKLARMSVLSQHAIAIDGKEDRLSPGARIRDTQNMLVLTGPMVGTTVPVVYKRDVSGLVHEVWLLNEDEYKRLGGVGSTTTPEGLQKFVDMLAAVWRARK